MRSVIVFAAFLFLIVSCGDDKVTEADLQKAREYADEHWIESEYSDDRENPTPASWCGWWKQWYDEWALDPFEYQLTHSLPETRSDDYYKMIGMYDQFVYGWDDVHDHLLPGDSTMAPFQEILIWSETWIDTAYFDPYISDVFSEHRQTYLDMIMIKEVPVGKSQ